MRSYTLVLSIIFLNVPGSVAFAETDNSQSTRSASEKLEKIISGEVVLEESAAPGPTPNGGDPMRPAEPDPVQSNAKTLEKYQVSMQAYYDYRTAGLDHRREVFEWQLFSAKLIFLVVLVLVASGIYFAAVQFHAGLRPGSKPDDMPQSEFEASLKGVKISSPILGVIILTQSLAFFYLYLIYVYPVEDIF